MVVFSIFLKATRAGSLVSWLSSQGFSPATVAWVAFRMAVIGPLWGIVLAGATLYFLKLNAYKDRDSSVEMVVTVAMPFLVFYSAETAFGEEWQLSGVLAVVGFGLTFASPWGRASIDPHAEHFLHGFWGSVGHLVNTLIFVISGLTIALRLGEAGLTTDGGSSINLGIELAKGLGIYAFMTVLRFAVVFGCIPLFRRGLYGFDWRDALVVAWGGLRGAVGLALALAVASDHLIKECDSGSSSGSGSGSSSGSGSGSGSSGGGDHCVKNAEEIKNVIMVHTCLVVVLTLLVNAPTAKPILEAIGLTRLGNDERSMVAVARQKLRRVQLSALERLHRTPINERCNWDGVQRLAGLEDVLAKVAGAAPPSEQEKEQRKWVPPPRVSTPGAPKRMEMVSAIYGKVVKRAHKWSQKAQVYNHWRVMAKFMRDRLLDDIDGNAGRASATGGDVLDRSSAGGVGGGLVGGLVTLGASVGGAGGGGGLLKTEGFEHMVGKLRQRQLHEARRPSSRTRLSRACPASIAPLGTGPDKHQRMKCVGQAEKFTWHA